MAKREDFSQGVNSGNSTDSNLPDIPGPQDQVGSSADIPAGADIRLAQANPSNPVFDLANAPVKATFTSVEAGSRIELPAGTAIDQVFISGLNLYLVQADGSVIIILGGAINYPTLILGPGIEIPADQLQAALENAQEGVPTAGPDAGTGPGSSGGNFAVDPGGIGDLLDLTPLLPPTALAFELFPVEDFDADVEEEEAATSSAPPTIGDPEQGFVEEDDLGNPIILYSSVSSNQIILPNGSGDPKKGNDLDGSASAALTFTGNLDVNFNGNAGTITFPAGLDGTQFMGGSVTSNNLPVFLSLANPQTLVGFTDGAGGVAGVYDPAFDHLIFEVTLTNPADPSTPGGSYTINVICNLDHDTPVHDGQDGDTDGNNADGYPTPADEEIFDLLFPFIATNSDGSATGEFNVGWQDDMPIIGDEMFEESASSQSFSFTPLVDEDTGLLNSISSGPGDDFGVLTAVGDLNILWGADHGNDNTGNALGDRMVSLTGVTFEGQDGPIETLQALVPVNSGSLELTIADVTITMTTETVNGQDNQSVIRGTAFAGGEGYIVFEVTTSDLLSGSFEYTLKHPLVHPEQDNPYTTGTPETSYEDNILFTFSFNAKDSDGDTVSGEFIVDVDDDSPAFGVRFGLFRTDEISHDETEGLQDSDVLFSNLPTEIQALFTGVTDTGFDNDVASKDTGDAIGYARSIGLLVEFDSNSIGFGADGPAGGTTASGTTYKLLLGGIDSGLKTTESDPISLFDNGDGVVVGRYDSNGVGGITSDDDAAFAITIDPDSGEVFLVQYVSLWHPTPGASHDEPVTLLQDSVAIEVTFTDGDGDAISDSIGIGGQIKFEDDGPSIDIAANSTMLIHDETVGVQGDTDYNGTLTVFVGILNTGDDPHVPGDPIGFSQSAGALVDVNSFDFGSDGAAGSDDTVYALTVADGTDSGLKTTEGDAIFLFNDTNGSGDPVVVGRILNVQGEAAFALAIDPDTGVVSLVQYLSIQHDDIGDFDEANDDGTALNDAAPDDSPDPVQQAITNNALQVTVTVTDGDGDTASASADIGGQIKFEDDGPSIDIAVNQDAVNNLVLGLDESIVLPTTSGTDESGLFAAGLDDNVGITAVDGTNAIGTTMTSTGNISGLFTDTLVDAGTDGQKSRTDAYTLSLANAAGTPLVGIASSSFLTAEGVATTLSVTQAAAAGNPGAVYVNPVIRLFLVSSTVIEGRIDTDGNGEFETVALRIALDPSGFGAGDPKLTVDQILAVDHPVTSDFDDLLTLGIAGATDPAAGIGVTKTSTLVDGDDDSASDSETANITGAIQLEDDGPESFDPANLVIVNDGSAVAFPKLDVFGKTGTDGLGDVSFTRAPDITGALVAITAGMVAYASDGSALTSNGQSIFLQPSAGNDILEGQLADGTVIFRITLSEDVTASAADNYIVEFFAKIDDGAGTTVSNLTGAVGLNREHVAFQDLTGFPANSDVLISGTDGSTFTEDTVNGSSVGFGVGTGQRIAEDDIIRFDFVTNLIRTGSPTGTAFTIDTHFLVDGFTFGVTQLSGTGPQPNLATLMVRVYGDVDDDGWIAGNGWFSDEGPTATNPITQILVNGGTAASQDITATAFAGDATFGTGFILEDVEVGDSFTIFSTGGFERIEVTNFANGSLGGNTFGVNHRDFDVGNIGFTQVVPGSEVDLAYEVQLTDSDLDATAAQLDINLQPEPVAGNTINLAATADAEVFAVDIDVNLLLTGFDLNEDFLDLTEIFGDSSELSIATFLANDVQISSSGAVLVDADADNTTDTAGAGGFDAQVASISGLAVGNMVNIIIDDTEGSVTVIA